MITALATVVLLAGPAMDGKKTEKHEHHASTVANPSFDKLKQLVGEWETKMPDGKAFRVSYRLASNGTTLVETMNGGTKDEMITVYHPDMDQVLMTHYCSSGTQPRMRAKKLDGETLAFSFVDVSNSADVKKGGYMSGLSVRFKDADHFASDWSMKMGDKDMPISFEWTRVKTAPSGG